MVFERLTDAAEMARITRSYVLKLGAEAVVPWLVVSTSGCVWRPARIP
jgi:hypothetical protein